MTATTTDQPQVNEVRLTGRISGPPVERVLPSGDEILTFRIVVPRPRHERSKVTVDTFDCVVRAARLRRTAVRWDDGTEVELAGSLRRRFFRTEAGSASRVQVEVTAGRRQGR